MEQMKLPRGIRNNNPLNIRIGNAWVGEVEHPTDNQFEQFTSMVYGLRAGFIILRRYIERYHINTIEGIISRWAPNNENNTGKYILAVSSLMDMSPSTEICFNDEYIMTFLVAAMVRVECGCDVNAKDILAGYRMAKNGYYSM